VFFGEGTMKFHFLPARPHKNWQDVSPADWHDWKWQTKNSLSTPSEFQKHFLLTDSEQAALEKGRSLFKSRITPYYASLINEGDPFDPIRRIALPQSHELELGHQQMFDPLAEKKNQPTPRIIHRYSDRVLFLATDFCTVYCRYCTRKHFTGKDQAMPSSQEIEDALSYISARPGIREVIFSGGDPFTLADGPLLNLVERVRKIEHVEIIRIGTRMPIVNPFRVTEDLAKELRKHNPVYLMVHFNHPRELTEEAARSVETFVDHGIPVLNQMVLLNGVNNHAAIVQALSRRLLYLRVKPYYAFQCDPSEGTDHLRTAVAESESIQQELYGHLSGLAMPQFSMDLPGGGGKTPIKMNHCIDETPGHKRYMGFDGVESEYIDPPADSHKLPSDYETYLEEWRQLKASKFAVALNGLGNAR